MTSAKSNRPKKTGLGAEAWFSPPTLAEEANAAELPATPAPAQAESSPAENKGDGKIRRTLALTPHAYLILERMKLHLLETQGQKATLGALVEEAVIDLAQKMGVRIA